MTRRADLRVVTARRRHVREARQRAELARFRLRSTGYATPTRYAELALEHDSAVGTAARVAWEYRHAYPLPLRLWAAIVGWRL